MFNRAIILFCKKCINNLEYAKNPKVYLRGPEGSLKDQGCTWTPWGSAVVVSLVSLGMFLGSMLPQYMALSVS